MDVRIVLNCPMRTGKAIPNQFEKNQLFMKNLNFWSSDWAGLACAGLSGRARAGLAWACLAGWAGWVDPGWPGVACGSLGAADVARPGPGTGHIL